MLKIKDTYKKLTKKQVSKELNYAYRLVINTKDYKVYFKYASDKISFLIEKTLYGSQNHLPIDTEFYKYAFSIKHVDKKEAYQLFFQKIRLCQIGPQVLGLIILFDNLCDLYNLGVASYQNIVLSFKIQEIEDFTLKADFVEHLPCYTLETSYIDLFEIKDLGLFVSS